MTIAAALTLASDQDFVVPIETGQRSDAEPAAKTLMQETDHSHPHPELCQSLIFTHSGSLWLAPAGAVARAALPDRALCAPRRFESGCPPRDTQFEALTILLSLLITITL